MDELKRFNNIYNLKKEDCEYLSYNEQECNKIMNNLFGNIVYRDCPDGYFYDKNNNIVYIYEHFEIDCSPYDKKGSQLRKSLAESKRITNKKIKEKKNGEITTTLDQGYSYIDEEGTRHFEIGKNGDKYRNNYINKFNDCFDTHSKHINLYKENCLKELEIDNAKFKIIFIVEDVTEGGTYYLKGRGYGDCVNPLLTRQFQNKLYNSNVDYLIFSSIQFRSLSILDKKNLNKEVIEKSIDLEKKEFFVAPSMIYLTDILYII